LFCSFGNPNAQPPTPGQTPTSAAFPSPSFQTPRANKDAFDNRSGWTPIFAEEYSVFNATPGRLTTTPNPNTYVDVSTPRPSTSSSNKRSLSSSQELAADIASHVHHTVQTNLPLPPVDPARRLSSSPGIPTGQVRQFEDKRAKTTPQNTGRLLQEPFSGQTATPPQSVTKGSRRLAPRFKSPTMQRDEDPLNMFNSPGQQNVLNFNAMDVFSYPISAPATTPAFAHGRPFWDQDAGMGGMDMNFSGGDPTLYDGHKISNSFDWGRNNQIFQETTNIPPFNPEPIQSTRRERPLASKPPPLQAASTGLSFGFGNMMSEDPFSMGNSNGAVDPGLLFTFPPQSSASISESDLEPRPSTSDFEPYQHQQRESRRDQEELRRVRSSRENSTALRTSKASLSSPAKLAPRPGLQRSVSDSRMKRPSNSRPSLANIAQRPIGSLDGVSDKGRKSPEKQLGRPNLASIPEFAQTPRAAVTFSIDANGRARTETTVVRNGPRTIRGGPPLSDGYDSSHSASSSDDEPIMIPSRTNSFTLPGPRSSGPHLGHSDTARRSIEGRGRSSSAAGPSSASSTSLEEQESEAETLMEGGDGSGDAANALRKVMESRRKGNLGGGNLTHYGQRSLSAQSTPRHLQPYSQSSSLTPSTGTDSGLTPSTDRASLRSDTRCVCNNRDGDGFMIQW
jgi:hypothetical protein